MTPDDISREIIKYCFEHDVLTQHGMAGLRAKINGLIEPADRLHELALVRINDLFGAEKGTKEGDELTTWFDAVHAYEDARYPELRGNGQGSASLERRGRMHTVPEGGRPSLTREQRRSDEMSNALFGGTVRPDDRVRLVATMMGYAPASLDYPREFIERTLSKAENRAFEFLWHEIAEAKRGEADRRRIA